MGSLMWKKDSTKSLWLFEGFMLSKGVITLLHRRLHRTLKSVMSCKYISSGFFNDSVHYGSISIIVLYLSFQPLYLTFVSKFVNVPQYTLRQQNPLIALQGFYGFISS